MNNRKSIRLKGYDYSQAGSYFITICTKYRAHLFGKIVDGKMKLNATGKIADVCWRAIPEHYPNIRLDEFVIMPNHVHGIIFIVERRGTVPVPGDNVHRNAENGETKIRAGRPRPYAAAFIINAWSNSTQRFITDIPSA